MIDFKKIFSGIYALLFVAFLASCDSNPFNVGPQYDFEGNLKTDSLRIAEYLETAEYDSLYRIHDPSGMVVIVQEEGTASRPVPNSSIIYANYVGKLTDGTVFDTNIESVARENDLHEEGDVYRPFEFLLVGSYQQAGNSGAIYGFSAGFEKLRSGSKAVLVIPSPYAYQDREREDIPANSILVFEVDFLGMD